MLNLGQDFRAQPGSRLHLPTAAGAVLLASEYFDRASRDREPDYQSVNADIDKDGDEDQYGIRVLPFTDAAGKACAAGASVSFKLEPLKVFKGYNFAVSPVLAESLLITSCKVGQSDFSVVTDGAFPMAGFVGRAEDNLLDLDWAGPGLSIYLTVKNIGADPVTIYGGIRGSAVIA